MAGVYKDNESGRTGRAEREAFDQTFTDASKGQFDLVLFWSLDRFSREGIGQTIPYLRQLESYDVHFNSYTELRPENELVRSLLLSTLAYFSRAYESERISERTKAGLDRVRANGKQIGRPNKVDKIIPALREINAQTRASTAT